MNTLLLVLVILVLLNLVGGVAVPTYRGGGYYGYSWGGILAVIVILYLLGFRL